jgi:hypothetical protein
MFQCEMHLNQQGADMNFIEDVERKALASVQAPFLDTVLNEHRIRNDAQLALLLEVSPPVISKIRNGWMSIGPSLLIAIEEATGRDIRSMKRALGLRVVGDPTGIKKAA